MRLSVILSLTALAGISSAQDTNFLVGPQYLITTGSPRFLQPIATPSLSLSSALQEAYMGTTELAPSKISSFMAATPSETFLGEVYWGEHRPSEIVARRLVTPSLTAEQTAFYTYPTANEASAASAATSAKPLEIPATFSVVEVTSANLPNSLPASLFDPGVTAAADPQSLRDFGYGASLGELSNYWKSHKRPGRRVFTNQELHHN
jgi:hypothetical protein